MGKMQMNANEAFRSSVGDERSPGWRGRALEANRSFHRVGPLSFGSAGAVLWFGAAWDVLFHAGPLQGPLPAGSELDG